MDGWNTCFLLGWPILRCELLVSGRVLTYNDMPQLGATAGRIVFDQGSGSKFSDVRLFMEEIL